MAKIEVFNNQGKKIKDQVLKLDLGLDESLVSQVLRVEQANIFKKSGKTKTRAEVSGGGRKPWRQKGTGRARAGSIRSPLFRGGGVSFGPTGESRTLKIPIKMKLKAYLEVLSWQAKRKNILILDSIEVKSGKTKDAAALLDKISKSGRSLLVFSFPESKDLAPWRNLPLLEMKSFREINLIDLSKNLKLIFTSEATGELKRRFKDV